MEGALGVLLVAVAVVVALRALRAAPSAHHEHAARRARSESGAGAPDQELPQQTGRLAPGASVASGVGAALERLSATPPSGVAPPARQDETPSRAATPGPSSARTGTVAPPAPGRGVARRENGRRADDGSSGAGREEPGGQGAAGGPGGREEPGGQGTAGGPGGREEPGGQGAAGGPGGRGPGGHGRHRGAGDPRGTAHTDPRHTDPRQADRAPARSRLFHPGAVDGAGFAHHGPYACLHLHTTGLSPGRDRILEVAVVRCTAAGKVASQWSTLLDPEGREVSAGWFHGLTAGALQGAPTFAEIASELLTQCEDAVVVAHHADFVESFVAGALLRSGVLAPSLPVLPLARLAAASIPTPNTRLATLGALAGRPRTVPSGALADARILAAILPSVLGPVEKRIRYPVEPIPRRHAKHRRRPALLSRAPLAGARVPSGYLADLLATVPASAAEHNDPRLATYLDALMSILAGGIVAEEVRELTAMAVRSGYRADAIRGVHQRVLESLRSTAFGRGRVAQTQVRHLRAAAHSLGIPGYFDDLVAPPAPPAPPPGSGSGSFSRPVRKPPPPTPPAQSPRCGHCLGLGHYTAQCPQLRRRRGGSVGPIGGVPGFGPIDPISPI